MCARCGTVYTTYLVTAVADHDLEPWNEHGRCERACLECGARLVGDDAAAEHVIGPHPSRDTEH